MIEITREKLIYDFLKTTNKPIDIYIDSPFCVKKCKFCIYAAYTDFNKEKFDAYYSYVCDYLKDAEPLFKTIPIQNIYFGGGTASLMTIPIMEKIIAAIPNFDKIKYKSIEIHAAMLTDEKVDFLIKNKFTFVSVAVQTFNEDILKAQNRIGNYNIERMKRLIKKMKDNGISVSMDFLAYMTYVIVDNYTDEYRKADSKQLIKDITFAANYLKPSVISVYPNYLYIFSEQNKSIAKKAFIFQKDLKSAQDNINMHANDQLDKSYLSFLKDFEKGNMMDMNKNYRFFEDDSLNIEKSYVSTAPRNDEKERSIFAIGGLRNSDVDSSCYGTLLGNYNYYIKLKFDSNNNIQENIFIRLLNA